MDYIEITVGFVTGLIAGLLVCVITLSNSFSITNNQLLEGSAMCAVNGDLLKIRTSPSGFVAVCINGAEFKLKEE